MNLDLSYFDFIKKDELRVLTAIEMGMRNHEWVPEKLISKIANLKRGNAFKVIQTLLKHKLIAHYNKKYEGYKLHYPGYDFLALSKFRKQGLIENVEMKIGVGKESDIYLIRSNENKLMVLKLARLGRASFKTVKNNRDYLQGKTHYNWLYLSRIAAFKEFSYMSCLYENGFPVPVPVAYNRHAIIMSFINGFPLNKVKEINNPEIGYNTLIDLIEKFALNGLIHSDFNEFNIMIDNSQRIWVIDFPQMISTNHPNAQFYIDRDVKCINDLFERRYHFEGGRQVVLENIDIVKHLDQEVMASGSKTKQELKELALLSKYYEDIIDEKEEDEIIDDDEKISKEEELNENEEYSNEEEEDYKIENEEYYLDQKEEFKEKLLLNQQQ